MRRLKRTMAARNRLHGCLSLYIFGVSRLNLFVSSIALVNFLLREEGLDGDKRVRNLSYFVGKTGFVLP